MVVVVVVVVVYAALMMMMMMMITSTSTIQSIKQLTRQGVASLPRSLID